MSKRDWKKAVWIGLVILLVVFTVQNASEVRVNFLIWSFSMSRIFLILMVFLIGFGFGQFYAPLRRKK